MADDDVTNVWYDEQGRPHLTIAPGAPVGQAAPIQQGLPVAPPDLSSDIFAPQQPITPGFASKAYDILTGSNGQERYQLFPERIVRSALSLPTDVMSGKVQTAVSGGNQPLSSDTGPEDELLQRVQDMAALMGGGGIGMAEKGALGSSGGALKVGENEYNLFHGSNKPIESIADLQPSKSGEFGPGTYFSDNPDTAYMFGSRTGEEGSHIIPSVVKMEKPFTVTKQDWLKMTETKTPRQIQAKLKEQGYDGIIGIGINGVDKQYVPFNNSQVRSSILKSDNEAAAPIAALENAPTFHSAVENAVNTSTLKSANPEQWLGTIKNAKGVKPEELDWTGLKDWLGEQSGPVSKEQVQDYLNANKVGLGEVNKGEYKPDKLDDRQYSKDLDRIAVRDFGQLYDHIPDSQQQQVRQAALERQNQNPTKYSKYQLPGGTSYREKLLTLPKKEVAPLTEKELDEYDVLANTSDHAMSNEQKQRFKELDTRANEYETSQYKSSHWDEPNILAHIRMNDRFMPDENGPAVKSGYQYQPMGSNRVTLNKPAEKGHNALHIEEIQSDWHQQGREHGYKTTPEQKAELETIDQKLMNGLEEKDIGNPDMDAVLKTAVDKKVITSQEAANYKQYSKGENSTIPDAPFKKTWLDLALKRVIREAAEQSKDRISWTPGEAQAARYDLSKQVEQISFNPSNGQLKAYKKGGNGEKVIDEKIKPSELASYVGKDAANRLINEPSRTFDQVDGKYHILEGDDLKVGGEGMHYFYDKMLPAALERLTGQKMKVGSISTPAKVSKYNIRPSTDNSGKTSYWVYGGENLPNEPFTSEASARKWINDNANEKKQSINYIDLPQSVKDVALHKGFPLFSSGLMLSPVEDDPFKRSGFKLTPVKEAPKFK